MYLCPTCTLYTRVTIYKYLALASWSHAIIRSHFFMMYVVIVIIGRGTLIVFPSRVNLQCDVTLVK